MESLLRGGLGSLELALPDVRVRQLLDYASLMQKWARVYNLTALRTPEEIVTHHLLDSLAVVPSLQRACNPLPRRALDVGSGAGLPGVAIAIACPEMHVDCVDSTAKKAAFIQQVAASLRLPNLRGLHSRVEELGERYPLVMSRAFASLRDFVTWSDAALEPGGVWLAMKGRHPGPEIQDLPPGVEMFHVEQIQVPGLDAERCLVWMRRRAP